MTQPAFKLELRDLKKTMDALEQLPRLSMQKAAVVNALKKAAVPIRDAAKVNAAGLVYGSDKISESIVIETKKQPDDKSKGTVCVGSLHPQAHLFEFGTSELSETGEYTPPTPFLRKAWEAKKKMALDILVKELSKTIREAAR